MIKYSFYFLFIFLFVVDFDIHWNNSFLLTQIGLKSDYSSKHLWERTVKIKTSLKITPKSLYFFSYLTFFTGLHEWLKW